ncbi:MAG TPA: DUF2264 domain-containing protein [Pyrinomonadaceae bacterium]|nr:DUF2264 domain-containing protein [Pyrinomonadaceae bacterium]
MKRRNFIKKASAISLIAGLSPNIALSETTETEAPKPSDDRTYWVQLLDKIANPVLSNMSRGELQKNMRVEYSPTWDKRDSRVAYMEAFGRLIAGLAPFVSLLDDNSAESKIRSKMRLQIQQSLAHAVNPKSPDYLYWGDNKTRQPLVDAAYIAQALLTAPEALWNPLDKATKDGIIREFKTIRQIVPFNNNWVLFAATIESFLLSIDEEIDAKRIDPAIETINNWYVGDGWYKDGEKFHFDHYNGYVIQPMLVEVLKVNAQKGRKDKALYDTAYKRMQRYASFQERYISPEGTYPVFGRSSTYRVGAFQPLAKLALEDSLPKEISPAQVRCALTAVMKRMFVQNTFTKDGWLTLGLVGNQQSNIADSYSNTGSMYITSLAFLPLGLPVTHKFWADPFTEWTQLKAWGGKSFAKDYAVDY